MGLSKPDLEVGAGPDRRDLLSSYAMTVSRALRWVASIAFSVIVVSALMRLAGDPGGWDIGLSLVQLVFYSL
ncbi:hypothetical protein [Kineococcus aurantiacus]